MSIQEKEQEQTWSADRQACLARFNAALQALLLMGSVELRREFLTRYELAYGVYAAGSLKQAFKSAWDARR